jgi:hypothetical protein
MLESLMFIYIYILSYYMHICYESITFQVQLNLSWENTLLLGGLDGWSFKTGFIAYGINCDVGEFSDRD